MEINKLGKFYHINRNSTENDKQLIERSWFIVNSLHNDKEDTKVTIKDLTEAEKNSRIWFNKKFLECRYPEHVEKKIEDIESKIFS